jgi:hypothetical protein
MSLQMTDGCMVKVCIVNQWTDGQMVERMMGGWMDG